MKDLLKTYGILSASLLVLFGSGIVIGRLTAPGSRQVNQTTADVDRTTATWIDTASRGLVRDLMLTSEQERQVREQIQPVGLALHADQERALFQMHLRLLLLHDSLAASGVLTELQGKRLGTSRAKLKSLIIGRFPSMVHDNPVLAIDNAGGTP